MSSSIEQITLSELFKRALENASKAVNLSGIHDEAQIIISSSLQDLRTLAWRINVLGLFSPNESFDEISPRNIPYMLVPHVLGEMQFRVRAIEAEERVPVIESSKTAYKSFIRLLDEYQVISEQDKKLHASKLPSDAYKSREMKIEQAKGNRAIRDNVETLRNRRRKASTSSPLGSTDFDLIASLLPSQGEVEDDDEEEMRELLQAVLKLFWVQALERLKGIEMEEDMLRRAPPKSSQPSNPENVNSDDDTWRLDLPMDGRLVDEKGKVLRPFVILPSNAAERERLKAEVFRPDHRLPTMTVDELLDIERKQGKFISGGGEKSYTAPTSKELLQEASEMDGTLGGEEKSEEKRLKDESWAVYTEENPKGMGNTLNRG